MLPKKVTDKIAKSKGVNGQWKIAAGKHKHVFRAKWRLTGNEVAILLSVSIRDGDDDRLLVTKMTPVANMCYYIDAEEGSAEMLGVEENTNDSLRQAMTVLFTAGLCELSDTINDIDKLFIVDEAVSKAKAAENE